MSLFSSSPVSSLLLVHLMSVFLLEHGNLEWPSVCHGRSAPAGRASSSAQQSHSSTMCMFPFRVPPQHMVPVWIFSSLWIHSSPRDHLDTVLDAILLKNHEDGLLLRGCTEYLFQVFCALKLINLRYSI